MRLVPVETFQGLHFQAPLDVGSDLAVVIGRNGAGKSRLLLAIAEGKVQVLIDGSLTAREQILHLPVEKLSPSLMFGFDPVRHRDELEQAMAMYDQHRETFDSDPAISFAAFGGVRGSMGRTVNVHQLCQAVSAASAALGKDVKSLERQDVADYFDTSQSTGLGALNVTATMLAYHHRQEKNQYNHFKNREYGRNLPYWTADEFTAKFGPPPWEVFNDFLRTVLDGRYRIDAPTEETAAVYQGQLVRDDGLPVGPTWLSSGEKVLMWLCLSMYAAHEGKVSNAPRLLLLDEPDASLHPRMVCKLFETLRIIRARLGSKIILTTHSPTTVALFDDGPILRVSEQSIVPVDKDAAVGELLVGVDRIAVQSTNRRQVYVESHYDADLYSALYRQLKRRGGLSQDISLSFIPAAPKLAESEVRKLLKAHLPDVVSDKLDAFVIALNGQGDCTKVIGAVESLVHQGNVTVHGIIDWDTRNISRPRIHVLGKDKFYAIENAILNPLTLGLFLLHFYFEKVSVLGWGLPKDFERSNLYANTGHWQSVADAVCREVLQPEELALDVVCPFVNGDFVSLDRRYLLLHKKELERKILKAYPFLNEVVKGNRSLMEEVLHGVGASDGATIPTAFVEVFEAVESGR
jgi:ABC-type cobalamin/Fe3+-siderophores transport system ATPase subunit